MTDPALNSIASGSNTYLNEMSSVMEPLTSSTPVGPTSSPTIFKVDVEEGFFSSSEQPYSPMYNSLIDAPWLKDSELNEKLFKNEASFQTLNEGSGRVVLDQYSIVLESLPRTQSPTDFVHNLANDISAGVNDEVFGLVNEFNRRESGSIQKGDIYDIDIFGPINGSVMVVDVKPLEFTVQTIRTPQETHPEMGARTFGLSKNEDGTYTFFTRGVSRPRNFAISLGSKFFQPASWSRMMSGISDQVNANGGVAREGSFNYHHSTISWNDLLKMKPELSQP